MKIEAAHPQKGGRKSIEIQRFDIVKKEISQRHIFILDCSNRITVVITRLSDCKDNIILIAQIK